MPGMKTGVLSLVGEILPTLVEEMKNQYFADVNDYRKYGLLRLLSDNERVPTAICWMLTENDNGTHGNNNGYVDNPKTWRSYDPALFDILKNVIIKERTAGAPKDVKVAEEHQIVRSALYYDPSNSDQRIYLTANNEEREKYFDEFFKRAKPYKLIFFDPDNGLEARSAPYRQHTSSTEHLYWHELERAVKAGHSVLLYQHFPQRLPRDKRDDFIVCKAEELGTKTGKKKIYSFRTSHVVFFLVLQNEHLYTPGIQAIGSKWRDQITIKTHKLK